MTNLPQNENKVKPEIHLSRLAYALVARLTELRNKFRAKGSLAKDGSFFQGNIELAKWLHVTERGIQKARKQAIDAGKIKYEAVAIKGKACLYWILDSNPLPGSQEPPPTQEKPPLNPAEVREFARAKDREFAIRWYVRAGYTEAEIIRALEEPK